MCVRKREEVRDKSKFAIIGPIPFSSAPKGRIIKEIEIEGQRAIALFDTGAVYTYVRESLVAQSPRAAVLAPIRVALGGQSI